MEERLPRKLAAILYADVAGYSRLTGEDEDATHRALSEYLNLISNTIESHGGKVMHYAGDAVLAKFEAVVDTMSAAIEIQNNLHARNEDLPKKRRVEFRVGVNLGDVIEDRGDIYGDGVNVAARLESLADPGGICISDAVRTATGKKLALEYQDLGEREVKNIEVPVRAYKVMMAAREESKTEEAVKRTVELPVSLAAKLASTPVVTVLPFENRSNDPNQQFLADGLAEDIAGALSRLRWLTIVDCSNTLHYKDQAAARQVALDFDVDFIVRGSVRRGGARLRVAVVLERADSGEHVWSERYDRDINEVFQIEDDICMFVLASLEVEISAAEQRRIRVSPPATLSAWEAYQCGLAARQGLVGVELKAAKDFFRVAIGLDPDFSAPKAALALAVANELGWALVPKAEREATVREAMALAVEAIRVDPREALGFAARARLHLHEGQSAAALADAQAALERNPNSSTALLVSALVAAVAGDARQALSDLEKVVRLSPLDPYVTGMQYGTASLACLRLGEYEQAIRWGEAGMQALQSATWSCAMAAAANIALGNVDRAKQIVDELLTRRPEFTISDMIGSRLSGNPKFRGWLIDRLSEAGIPD